MPGCNIFSQEHQMLLIHFFGDVTASDLELQAVSVLSHPDFTASTKELISFAEVDSFAPDVDMERLADIVRINKEHIDKYPDLKIAVIAPDSLSFNLARVYQESIQAQDQTAEMKIFTTKQEAIQWLGGNSSQWDLLLERVSKMCSL